MKSNKRSGLEDAANTRIVTGDKDVDNTLETGRILIKAALIEQSI